ncbi:MAG: hypothetical protein AB7W16_10695 [Candidatus Obscuribacterales bacterium]
MYSITQYILVFITASVLSVFCGLSLIPHEVRHLEAEQRLSNPLPALPADPTQIPRFASAFDAYLSDNMPMRSQLVALRNLARLKMFNATDSSRVVMGRDGWLFLGGTSITYFRNAFPYTDESLKAWTGALARRQQWLAQRGVPYLLVLAPNKETIYREFFPSRYNKVRPDSRCDQFVEAVRNTDLAVLDLREPLNRKKDSLLYFKTDTHWNHRGALIATGEILKQASARLPSIKAEPPEVRYEKGFYSGDLARMLDLEEILREPEEKARIVKSQSRVLLNESMTGEISPEGGVRRLISTTGDGNQPRALILRDSFATAVQPFLSERFSEAVYCWQHDLPARLVDKTRPDIVIEILCERFLMDKEPQNEF